MKNLILICGNEEYLKEQKKQELLERIHAKGSINYNSFTDDNLDLLEIRRLIDTVPLFEEYRKILITNSGLFKKPAGSKNSDIESPDTDQTGKLKDMAEADSVYGMGEEQIEATVQSSGRDAKTGQEGLAKASENDAYDPVAIFSDIPQGCIVIFFETNVYPQSPLYKLIKKQGEIFRFENVESKRGQERRASETEVRNWAAGLFRAAGRRIDAAALNYLIQLTGYDMENLSGEIEKLICYMLDKPASQRIGTADINAICSRTLQDRVFAMLESHMRGRTGEAVQMLEELFALKVPPMKTLYLLTRQYNQALSVRECQNAGMSDAEICSKTELKDWQLRRVKEQVSGVSAEELKYALESCADMEYRVKRGNMIDRMALELLMM